MNTLYFGDNLQILKDHFDSESVDLIYLDPPFNSRRDYNVLFREQSGHGSPAQIKAFGDTWNWAAKMMTWYTMSLSLPKIEGILSTLSENQKKTYLEVLQKHHRVLTKELTEDSTVLFKSGTLGSDGYSEKIKDFMRERQNFIDALEEKIAAEESAQVITPEKPTDPLPSA